MLEPKDIRTQRFLTVRQGYKTEDVDAFLLKTADEFLKKQEELAALKQVAGEVAVALNEATAKIQAFESERDSISRAVAKAQIMADKIMEDATKTVEETIASADKNAQETIKEAQFQADEKIRRATADAQDRLIQVKELAQKIEKAANEKAEQIEREAEERAYAALHSIESQRAAIRLEVDELNALSSRFKLDMINSYEKQLRLLRHLPNEIAIEMAKTPDTIHIPPDSPPKAITEPVTQQSPPKTQPKPEPPSEQSAPEEEQSHDSKETPTPAPVPKPKDDERFSGYFGES
ncbi:MAG: DivIVA domain-containing protein [Oscillospiraceae bacterium]|nr:DivIVA domain-containing protein [Oscillospiraceae bacterium]